MICGKMGMSTEMTTLGIMNTHMSAQYIPVQYSKEERPPVNII
jgi:hypothetical protein